MNNKSSSIYVIIGLIGILLLILAQKYREHVEKQAASQIQILERKIIMPRKKIPITKDPLNEKIEQAKVRIEEINKPETVAKRRVNINKTKNERAAFLKKNKIAFPGDPMATFIVKPNQLMEIGKGGSYTLSLHAAKGLTLDRIKNSILKELNLTNDELLPVSFTPNSANGFRNQSLFEAESNGLYHMFFVATHPTTAKIMVMHFTIKGMSRVVEQYVNSRYKQLLALN